MHIHKLLYTEIIVNLIKSLLINIVIIRFIDTVISVYINQMGGGSVVIIIKSFDGFTFSRLSNKKETYL